MGRMLTAALVQQPRVVDASSMCSMSFRLFRFLQRNAPNRPLPKGFHKVRGAKAARRLMEMHAGVKSKLSFPKSLFAPMHVTPQYLYKYRAVDADALAMLATDKVYLSRLDAFNDPYEFLICNSDVRPLVDRQDRLTVEKACGNPHSDAASLRVCALSAEYRDLLMWGHYGDRHRGFCIRFEFGKDAQICKMLYPVTYQPSIPSSDQTISGTKNLTRRNILTKSDKWSYEREWRIIGPAPQEDASTAELFASYKPEALSGIVFGVRTSELHKVLIRTLLKDRRVAFLQAKQQQDDFALEIEMS